MTSSYYFSSDDVDNFLNREVGRRQSNKVLHAHPSPQLWQSLDSPIETRLQQRQASTTNLQRTTNLYMGIPFCLPTNPGHCGFCLFPTQDYRGNEAMNTYLDMLAEEATLYAPYYGDDTVKSIYIGGGTPNLMRPPHYFKVMDIADQLYKGIPKDVEITLEGIPQLFNREKLLAIKQAGINRLSMGVQQLSDKLIKHSGRKQTRKQVFNTLDICQELGLSCNIDLIYGWPEQTIEDMLDDLQALVEAGVPHITHYELNIAGRSAFASSKRDLLPSIEENILFYQIACDYLHSQGYQQITVYDWEKTDPQQSHRLHYEDNLRSFAHRDGLQQLHCHDLCGIGYAGLSFHFHQNSALECFTYGNQRNLNHYYQKLEQGQFPIERGYYRSAEDTRLCWLFQAIQGLKINLLHYTDIFGSDAYQDYLPAWQGFLARDWIRIEHDHIVLTQLGQYYNPILQSCLAAPRNIEIRQQQANTRQQQIQAVELH